LLPIPEIGSALTSDGQANVPWLDKAAGRFIDEMIWYAEALRHQRGKGTPY
jgi:hypothetical protein